MDYSCTFTEYDPTTGKYETDCSHNEQESHYNCDMKMVDMGDKVSYITDCTDEKESQDVYYCSFDSIGLGNGGIKYGTTCKKLNL